MADIFDGLDPAEITLIARAILAEEDQAENVFQLSRWFPATEVDGIDYEFDAGSDHTYTDAMPFRAWSTEAPLGYLPGRVRKTGEIPPMSLKFLLTERQWILLTDALAQGGDLADTAPTIIRHIRSGIKAMRNRLELAMGEALASGTLTLAENGVQLSVDWGRAAGAETTVGTSWATHATATPLQDEEAVMDALRTRTGLQPSDFVAVYGRSTWRNWKSCQEVQDAAKFPRAPTLLSETDANTIRRDAGLPDVIVYDAETNDVDGSTTPIVPADIALYLPRNFAVGATQYGVPAMARNPRVNLEAQQRPGPVAYVITDLDPMTTHTVVDAIALPTFADTDATHALDTVP